MMPSVLNVDPILSVPNANVPTVPNVPKMTMNDPSVPKTYLVHQQKHSVPTGVPNAKCTKLH